MESGRRGLLGWTYRVECGVKRHIIRTEMGTDVGFWRLQRVKTFTLSLIRLSRLIPWPLRYIRIKK